MKSRSNSREKQRSTVPIRARRLPPLPDCRVNFDLMATEGLYNTDSIATKLVKSGILAFQGSRDIDQFVFATAPTKYAVLKVREGVAKAAMYALRSAHMNLREQPLFKTVAGKFLEDVSECSRAAGRVAEADFDGELGLALVDLRSRFAGDPASMAANMTAVRDTADLLRALCDQFQALFPRACLPPNSNRDELPWNFIEHMATSYTEWTGNRPSRSKSGPFVQLLAAAWDDIHWPVPLDRQGNQREDLEDWFGDLVEKHPSITARKPCWKKV